VRAIAVAALVVGVGGACSTGESASVVSTPTTAAGGGGTVTTGTSAHGSSTAAASMNAFENVPIVARNVSPSVVAVITSEGLGSGVIYSSDGTIVTNQHVVGTNTTVQVAFADGERVQGTVKATDEITDLAVVTTSAKRSLPAARFQTKVPALGDLAIAIGSPLGLVDSVTAGVISGLSRAIPGSASQSQSLVDLIQTDAAISPGNSGGALVNGAGEVVGITEAYLPPSSGAVSIGFAIPSATVKDIVEQLLTKGTAAHSFLGVSTGELTDEIAQQMNTNVSSGIVVLDVPANGPAAKAGLQPGDIITGVDGATITAPEDLIAALRKHQPGDTITVEFVRDGQRKTAQATLSDRSS
jgi:serine protease DegQ